MPSGGAFMADILIADDDEALRALVERTLLSEGHSVQVVGDGGEALERFQSGALPDVLIADIDMPVIDGIALAGQALSMQPQLRILMISGMTERLEAAATISAVHLATLQKPFTLEALRDELGKLLG